MKYTNYVKGRRKEYAIVKTLRKRYHIAQRSAGSHSPIDIFAINLKTKEILFVQAKPDNYPLKEEQKLYDELKELTGVYNVTFEVR